MNSPAPLPVVSVMIITYNQAHFIRETIDSVLAQDYPRLEIVIADDASKDETPKILREYAAAHPGVFRIVCNEKNLGITGNSNAGLLACTGDLIAIMGGDDIFLPGKIHAQVEQFRQHPDLVLSYHAVEIFESATNTTLFVSNQHPREDTDSYQEILVKGGIPGASSVMVRRSAIPRGGFDERLPTVSDWQFYVEVALRGKVMKADGVLGRYRKHGRGASDRTLELLEESLYALDLVVQKNPEFRDLPELCRKAKARYIAGEVFRQLTKSPSTALELTRRCVELDPNVGKYRWLSHIATLNASSGLIHSTIAALLPHLKYFAKRRLG